MVSLHNALKHLGDSILWLVIQKSSVMRPSSSKRVLQVSRGPAVIERYIAAPSKNGVIILRLYLTAVTHVERWRRVSVLCSRSSGKWLHKGTCLLAHDAVKHEVNYLICPLSHSVLCFFFLFWCFFFFFLLVDKGNFAKLTAASDSKC